MDFFGGPMVKTLCFQYRGHGFNPWLGNKDPTCHKAWSKKKKERKERNRGSSVVKQVAVIGDANL